MGNGDVSAKGLKARADLAVGRVLSAIGSGADAVTVASPPGAGKSYLIEMASVQEAGIYGRTVAIATTTRAQGRELVQRLTRWKGITPVWFVPKTQQGAEAPPGAQLVRSAKEIPEEGAVVVATAAKWARTNGVRVPLLICDEAWQLPFASFAPLAPLADRFLLVGDPGQIAPVVQVDISRWEDEAAGPHVPAPVALRGHGSGEVVEVALPATRRLPADSAALVSEAFYPRLPFGSLAPAATVEGVWPTPDASLSIIEVGEPYYGAHDPWLAAQAAEIVQAAVRGASVRTGAGVRRVGPADIGVVCPYVHQVPIVRAALGEELRDVFVETANRWQGLERDLVVALHPLSGQPEPSSFSMDAGRLCVMCSRHKVACVLLSRPGVADAAAAGSGGAERSLAAGDSAEHLGWKAHMVLLEALGD